MKPAPSFELSPDTRFLRQRLHELKPGEEIAYAELGKLISKEVSGSSAALQSAMRGMRKDGYVFSPIRGVGVRRLTDAEIVAASDGDIDAIRRKAKRGAQKLAQADFAKLNNKQQLSQVAKLSIMGAVAAMVTNRAVDAVEKAAGGQAGELPIKSTLKALGLT